MGFLKPGRYLPAQILQNDPVYDNSQTLETMNANRELNYLQLSGAVQMLLQIRNMKLSETNPTYS